MRRLSLPVRLLLALPALACAAPRPPPRAAPADPGLIAEPPHLHDGADGGRMADLVPDEAPPTITDAGVPLYNPIEEKHEAVEESVPPEEDAPAPAAAVDRGRFDAASADARRLFAAHELPGAMAKARAAESAAAPLPGEEPVQAAKLTARIATAQRDWTSARRALDRALARCAGKGAGRCRRGVLGELGRLASQARDRGLAARVKRLEEAEAAVGKVAGAGAGGAKKLLPDVRKALAAFRAGRDPLGALRARAAVGALEALAGDATPALSDLAAASRAARDPRKKTALAPFLAQAGRALAAQGDLDEAVRVLALDARARAAFDPPEARRYARTAELDRACDAVNARKPGACMELIRAAVGEPIFRDFAKEVLPAPPTGEVLARVYGEYAGTLSPCLAEEARRKNLVGTHAIEVDWTVGNDGRVSEVHLGHRSDDGSPLHRCLEEKLSLWRYPRFPGERANVTQEFELRG